MLDDIVYGHEECKKALTMLVKKAKFRYNLKYYSLGESYGKDLPSSMKLFMVGESGTGKTLMLETLAKMYTFPLVKLDATRLGPVGNVDCTSVKDIEKLILKTAESMSNRHKDRYPTLGHALDRTVVFIDELDKLATKFDSTGNWNTQIQSTLLTLIDNKSGLSGVSWVFAGSFMSHRAPTETKASIGFFGETESSEVYTEFTDADFIRAGLLPELVGRLNMICSLDTFDRDDYEAILDRYVLKEKQKELKLMHIDLNLTSEQRDTILNSVVASKQGVRNLIRGVNKIALGLEYAILNNY